MNAERITKEQLQKAAAGVKNGQRVIAYVHESQDTELINLALLGLAIKNKTVRSIEEALGEMRDGSNGV